MIGSTSTPTPHPRRPLNRLAPAPSSPPAPSLAAPAPRTWQGPAAGGRAGAVGAASARSPSPHLRRPGGGGWLPSADGPPSFSPSAPPLPEPLLHAALAPPAPTHAAPSGTHPPLHAPPSLNPERQPRLKGNPSDAGIREVLLLRYFDLQAAPWPLEAMIRAFSMLHNLVLADPSFLFKVGTEVAAIEVQKRGKDFWEEFELYAADLLVGVAVDIALVGLLAPYVRFGKPSSSTGLFLFGRFNRMAISLPSRYGKGHRICVFRLKHNHVTRLPTEGVNSEGAK